MRSSILVIGAFMAPLVCGLPALASDAAETAQDDLPVIRWEDFDDPAFDPLQPQRLVEVEASDDPSTHARAGVTLGPIGMDTQGRKGRIHLVATGDTLWDISDAYLGTPWVWPSIWNENGAIQNPHRISPGDRIWITSSEMRSVTEEEAEELVAAQDATPFEPEPVEETLAAAPLPEEPSNVEELEPIAPVHVKPFATDGREVMVSWRESMGFVSDEELKAASSIVGTPELRVWLASGDRVYLGLGEGEVEVGDQYTVFEDPLPIRDPETRMLLGHHIGVLGWVEITQVTGETSIATIRQSFREMNKGDYILPRDNRSPLLKGKAAPADAEAVIVFMPSSRTLMGSTDYVFLNRGSIHGFEEGTALDVYESGKVAYDRVRKTSVQMPDRTVANLYVVSVQPESSVAFVYHTLRELAIGDTVRGSRMRASLGN